MESYRRRISEVYERGINSMDKPLEQFTALLEETVGKDKTKGIKSLLVQYIEGRG